MCGYSRLVWALGLCYKKKSLQKILRKKNKGDNCWKIPFPKKWISYLRKLKWRLRLKFLFKVFFFFFLLWNYVVFSFFFSHWKYSLLFNFFVFHKKYGCRNVIIFFFFLRTKKSKRLLKNVKTSVNSLMRKPSLPVLIMVDWMCLSLFFFVFFFCTSINVFSTSVVCHVFYFLSHSSKYIPNTSFFPSLAGISKTFFL